MSDAVLGELQALLMAEGGLMATLVDAGAADNGQANGAAASPAQAAAAGPRAEGRRAEYALLVEAIYEGYLLH